MLTRPSPVTVPESEAHWIATVAEFARDAATRTAEHDANGQIPLDDLRALSATGLDVAFLPREHGGETLSFATLGSVVRILATAHPALAAVWLMHLGAAHSLVTGSSPEAAAFFAAELAAGKRFSNALSEPAGGNFFLAPQQDVEPVEGGWTITGVKRFVSGGEVADHFFMNFRVDGQPAFFGVSRDETVSYPPLQQTMGMRATRSRTVQLTGTILPAGRLCPPPTTPSVNLITAGFAFLSIGIAESAIDAIVAATKGRPALAEAEWVKSETASVWAQLRAARLLAEQTLWLADRGDLEALANGTEAKMLANEVAKAAAALALKVGGGGAYLETSPIQRIFRDAQAGALMAYSVPFSQLIVGGWVLSEG